MLLLRLMRFPVELKPFHLKVISSVFADLTAGWLLALVNAKSPWVLTGCLIGVIFSLYIAFEIEKLLEEI